MTKEQRDDLHAEIERALATGDGCPFALYRRLSGMHDERTVALRARLHEAKLGHDRDSRRAHEARQRDEADMRAYLEGLRARTTIRE